MSFLPSFPPGVSPPRSHSLSVSQLQLLTYSLNFLNFPSGWATLATFSLVVETSHFKNYMGNCWGFKSYQQKKLVTHSN